jgi:hypothetical protein
MDSNYTIALTIVGSVIVALITFMLNGWRERTFERKKTNYGFKLQVFQEICQISSKLSTLHSRFLLIAPHLNKSREQRRKGEIMDELIVSLHMLASMELPGQLEPSRECMALANRYIIDRTSLTDTDLNQLDLNIFDGYVTALTFYLNQMIERTMTVSLVAEDTDVLEASAAVLHQSNRVLDALNAWLKDPKALPTLTLTDYLFQTRNLFVAMRLELDVTMLSGLGRRTMSRRARRAKSR